MRRKTKPFNKPFLFILCGSFLLIFLSFVGLEASAFPEEVLQMKASIKGKMLVSYIDFLASDHCRGRETGARGMEVAIKYITTVLAGNEVEGAGKSGTYYQPVNLKTVSLDKGVRLIVEETALTGGVNMVKNARLDWDFLPVIISAEVKVTAPVVFAGYGITAPDHKYNDYKNFNAAGKIVLVMRHEPGENDEKSPFDGQKNSKHGTLLRKILNAQDHGAVGILFVTDPLNHDELSVRGGSFMSGTWWPTLLKEQLQRQHDEDIKYRQFSPRMRIIGEDFGVKIPAAMIDGKLADYILGEKYSLLEIQKKIDSTMTPGSFSLPGKKVTLDIFFKNEPVEAGNIVAKVEGSDPELKHEVVIVGAHYDHVGKDNRGQVYPGADDNASGTAAVMELARAFQNLKQKPKRTILFILFTAEEKGLLGARYYVKNPIFPLEKTLAMICLDMVGRNDVDQLGVIGKYQYPELFKIAETINKKTANFELNLSVEEFIRNSDHTPFMREGIPCLLFNSGMHDQLHTPEDTVDRILPDKIEKATQLVFLTLWEVANLPAGTRLK
ncbi:MAG: M20/M25/M40 family metallo-hydrolase [Candidatus Aminicenantes bacterium]|nr:MAG: M20/M25/M40 family metallo-hydrolase [Candidatus Aminicenantes bacterium]